MRSRTLTILGDWTLRGEELEIERLWAARGSPVVGHSSARCSYRDKILLTDDSVGRDFERRGTYVVVAGSPPPFQS